MIIETRKSVENDDCSEVITDSPPENSQLLPTLTLQTINTHSPPEKNAKLIAIQTILENEKSDRLETFIQSVIEKAKQRFKRLPRNTWDTVFIKVVDLFKYEGSLTDLKNICAKGKSRQKNKTNEKTERAQESEVTASLTEISENWAKASNEMNVSGKQRTRRLYSKQVKHKILDNIECFVKGLVANEEPQSLNDVSNLLYLCQATYDKLTGENKNNADAIVDFVKRQSTEIEALEILPMYSA
eukprot:Filipodium_phascolosomae@DN2601_c0_g1_i2.p1